MIRTMEELRARACMANNKVIAVAAAGDLHTLMAVKAATEQEYARFILLGDEKKIKELAADLSFRLMDIPLIDVKTPLDAARTAVGLIRQQKADVLMKGMVSTAELLKAVLHKEKGLRTGNMLSMAAVFQLPVYHKLLILTDPAVNHIQDLDQKAAMLRNGIAVAHALGIRKPKVAPLCAVENAEPSMRATIDAVKLAQMAAKGDFLDVNLEGPMPLDVAVSAEAAKNKGIHSQISGDVDLLLTPNIEAGNVLYKTFVHLMQGRNAGVVLGAKAPIILTSRADSADAKLNSMALALLLSDSI